ncbi:MAG: hypothetical protein OEV42_04475 [Deltaproteobacteria bacterium]|nr:hypothetical protein [Deltaproteobacteria bacterium]
MGELNITFGWLWINGGIISGMIMGLWSFAGPVKSPAGLEDYSSLPRRFVRLGHVAFIALSIINILYGRELANINLSPELMQLGSYTMIFAALGMPPGCMAAAYKNSLKYFLVLPATSFMVAALIMAWGVLL